jgi:hypothetical protein
MRVAWLSSAINLIITPCARRPLSAISGGSEPNDTIANQVLKWLLFLRQLETQLTASLWCRRKLAADVIFGYDAGQ